MSMSPGRIAAVVVLYRPGLTEVENIRTWAGQVSVVYAVDNSDVQENAAVMEALGTVQGVTYICFGENRGVARALNIAAERAIEAGYDFLLTMDQDSVAAPGMIALMMACRAGDHVSTVGMIAPFHATKSGGTPPAGLACQEVMTPMTSGCLLNLSAYRSVGPFRDDFFIDFVDNEYCLRLRRAGFAVLRANRAVLEHSVGDTKKYGPFIATNHSPLRRYYKTRNRLQVFSEYVPVFPRHCLFDLVRLAKEIASIILFEHEKVAKIRMMWRGWCDFRQGKFGKYDGGCKV